MTSFKRLPFDFKSKGSPIESEISEVPEILEIRGNLEVFEILEILGVPEIFERARSMIPRISTITPPFQGFEILENELARPQSKVVHLTPICRRTAPSYESCSASVLPFVPLYETDFAAILSVHRNPIKLLSCLAVKRILVAFYFLRRAPIPKLRNRGWPCTALGAQHGQPPAGSSRCKSTKPKACRQRFCFRETKYAATVHSARANHRSHANLLRASALGHGDPRYHPRGVPL